MQKSINTLLFENKSAKSNILNKIKRYFIDVEIGRLTGEHIAQRKQLAVFAFDYISNQIIIDGIYEIDDLNILFNWLKSFDSKDIFKGVAIDIGANIGNHSLYFSDYFGEIFSFEPHPLIYKLLAINSELTNNVKCFNFGISSTNSMAFLKTEKRNMGGARLAQAHDEQHAYNVVLRTLDSELNIGDNKKVSLIKIDIEGHELDALIGAEITIKNHQPIIIFEQQITDFSGGTTKVIELLKSYNYLYFAQIEKIPYPPEYLPESFKLIYSSISRFFFGSSRRIVLVESFQPNFYPFIIAIPNWLHDSI